MPDLTFEKSKDPHPLPYRIKVRNSGVSAPFEGKSLFTVCLMVNGKKTFIMNGLPTLEI
jgi:hypothetical protein